MLSKARAKEIAALHQKKFRKELGLFLVEGEKMVDELLHSRLRTKQLVATVAWLNNNPLAGDTGAELTEAGPGDLARISTLITPNQVVAVVEIPAAKALPPDPGKELGLVLDGIQDPGNLGTIIRTADWFGIPHIFCSEDSVELYNPKVVQASMGGIFRVSVHYLDLVNWLPGYKKLSPYPVYGTFTDGTSIYSEEMTGNGLVILGNESRGIATALQAFVDRKLAIPPFGQSGAESLNVSVAAAIICSEFRRRTIRSGN